MSDIVYIIKGITDWDDLIQFILRNYLSKKLFLIYGDLGAGKTTFVQKFGKMLKVNEHISSPTFSIFHEYHYNANKKIYHFDLYRINHYSELKEIGIEDFLYEDNYCFIEWPEIIKDLIMESEELKNKTLILEIKCNLDIFSREVLIRTI